MIITGFDFGRPIDTQKTRDEIILVKFSGSMKNVGEMMYNAARAQSNFNSYWLERYTKFSSLQGKPVREVFDLLAPFTGAEFLKFMCSSFKTFNKLKFDTTLKDYAQLMSLCNPYNASTTNMELIFLNMLTYPFCKKMYIYDAGFSEISKMYIREVFKSDASKVTLIEGTLLDILNEKTEITSIFTDSAGEVCDVIQSEMEGSDKFAKKLFMISALPNIELDADRKIHYKYEKFLSETRERFKCETRWFQLKYVDNPGNRQCPEIKLKGEN